MEIFTKKKMYLIFFVIILAIIGIGSRFLFNKTDNIIEELVEKKIESTIGYDFDLSPETPEPEWKKTLYLNAKQNK